MLKSCSERLQCVIHALGFSFCEVSVRLDFTLDVLELCFELFLRLNTLHQHDIVVAVHLDQLVVHSQQLHVVILLAQIAGHILLDELHLGLRNGLLHDRVACRHQSR